MISTSLGYLVLFVWFLIEESQDLADRERRRALLTRRQDELEREEVERERQRAWAALYLSGGR